MAKKIVPFIFCCLIFDFLVPYSFPASAQETSKIHRFDGGMMLHTGFLSGNIEPLSYFAAGMPFGVGGVLHYHIGNHFRIGGEGYVSTLRQLGNGSYVKYGWGGLAGDFNWTFGHFMPYVGLTIGGGANTDMIMKDSPTEDHRITGESFYRKKGFMMVDPFIGCDYILSENLHLTLKIDCLCPLGRDLHMPIGPRLYFGVIFFH